MNESIDEQAWSLAMSEAARKPVVARYAIARRLRDRPRSIVRAPLDAVTVLTMYCVLALVIPSDLTVSGLGGAGSPAALWGLAAGGWWCWDRLHRWLSGTPPTSWPPVKVAMVIFFAANLASYIAGEMRATPTVEVSPSDTSLLKVLSWLSISVVAMDGIDSRERLLVLLRRITQMGGAFALFGLVQFTTGQSFVSGLSIPGLVSSQDYSNVQDRSGFTRSAATAMHPLEYGTVLCVVLPIALSLALHEKSRSVFARWWAPSALFLALVLSVSRSALVGLAIDLVVLLPTWPATVRRWAVSIGLGVGLVIYVAVPGLAGTVLNLFTGISQDASTASRTNSYSLVFEFVQRNPILGRGIGTFLSQYRILDNQYLLTLIETGIVGFIALLAVFGTAIGSSLAVSRASSDPLWRSIGYAFVAGTLSGAALFAFFDAYAFPKATMMLFLITACAGSMRSFEGRPSSVSAGLQMDQTL